MVESASTNMTSIDGSLPRGLLSAAAVQPSPIYVGGYVAGGRS